MNSAEGIQKNYERLEFLGMPCWGRSLHPICLKKVPHGNEGYSQKMRSKVVSREHLNELGRPPQSHQFGKNGRPYAIVWRNIHGMYSKHLGAIYLTAATKTLEKFIHRRVIKSYVIHPKIEENH